MKILEIRPNSAFTALVVFRIIKTSRKRQVYWNRFRYEELASTAKGG